MSEKRRDNRNRILREGEYQRTDGRYRYRYIDEDGKEKNVYSWRLDKNDPTPKGKKREPSLREKEKQIQADLFDHIVTHGGNYTVVELVEKYVSLKTGVSHNTRAGYKTVLNLLKKDAFGKQRIDKVRLSDAKAWLIKLQQADGRGYSSIHSIRGVLRPAFQMAYNEDVICKNPFEFKITDVVPNDSVKRAAMTEEEQSTWMGFIRADKTYSKYYDEFVVLLETGMRVSEFCGLTINDLDFEKKRIRVDHQLVRERRGRYYVEKTKTESGCRYIPMTDDVYHSLKRILANRPSVRVEMMIDGYTGFLLLDKNSKPKVALHIENEMRWAMKKYRKLYPNNPLPHITPHVFRHTFCTNMASAGLDIKKLQYIMGHSDVGVTMNVYTHMNYEQAAEQMTRVVEFRKAEKTKKLG